MNLHSISSMARSHREELMREAAQLRRARTAHAAERPVRAQLARAAHALGSACFRLGEALERAR